MGSEKQPDDLLDTAHDPMRIVGPGEAQAPPQDCEFKPGQLDGSPSESQFKAKEELQEGFSIEPTPMILSPVDGMPLPTDETAFEFAPT